MNSKGNAATAMWDEDAEEMVGYSSGADAPMANHLV
jgi:hypothetical protein